MATGDGERVTVILWDIDGTLVRAGGVGRTAFVHAIRDVLGLDAESHQANLGGKTDPQIALEILTDMGIAEADAQLPELLAGFEKALAALEGDMREKGWILPGVSAVITELARRPGVVQTLVTGNMKANARLKLDTFGLGEGIDMELGAYADDHADRCELVPIAVGRLTAAGIVAAPERIWVVGDTPRDLACAQAGGVRCLLVATGTYTRSELEDLGADAVFDDLSDLPAVIELLTA
jgi:phosphoglycolate phosphatase